MKLKFVTVVFLLITGLLLCLLGFLVKQKPVDGERYNDLATYQKYCMGIPEKQASFSITIVGDIMLSRNVAKRINELGDPNYAFDGVRWFFQGSDLIFGNLENPLTPGREIYITEMLLRADPEVIPALKNVGFGILSLANNHTLDFGLEGLSDTLKYLDKAAIKYTGAWKNAEESYLPTYMEAGGIKVAFLAFTDPIMTPFVYRKETEPGIAFLNPEKIASSIKESKANGDFTIVYLHRGEEYVAEPGDTEIGLAHLAIDAGADLVVGSHPHVVQKVEQYKGKFIFYSLGNFVFDQLWSRETREGIAAKIFINEDGVEKIEFLPVFMNVDCFPEPLDGERGQAVAEKLGLELQKERIPAWDSKQQLFTDAEQYVFYADAYKSKYRLTKSFQFDLDGNGLLENLKLSNGKIEVWSDTELLWQSPEEWWVDDFFVGDANNDGVWNLGLLVWKEGSFGPYQPFWLTERDNSFRNHLFIFKLEDGKIKPVWQSSNLERPNYHAELIDLDGDGKYELLVTEGSYTDFDLRKKTLWKWDGWGFTRAD